MKQPIDRRRFLTTGAAGLAAGAFGNLLAGTSANAKPERHEGGSPKETYWPRKQKPPSDPGAFKEFEIDVRLTKHELLPGIEMHALAFNGRVPGPELRVQEGDWVRVKFTNKTELLHTIHWHGVDLPYEMDGVPYVTQPPVMPKQTFVYEFRAYPAGTRFYHCHFGTLLHMQMAMHGALIIERNNDPIKQRWNYEREYTMVLSSFDLNWTRAELNRMLERMKQRIIMMKKGMLDNWTLGVFKSYEEYLAAIGDGYVPPYTTYRNQMSDPMPSPNFFAINGKSYPATEKLLIREGENIRIRLINAGQVEHYMHLHGHQFYKVADDGNDLAEPMMMNTVQVSPGKTVDIIVEGINPGYWTFHDHNTARATNNGIYPGGILTVLEYEGFEGTYKPLVALDE